ncbi:MAG: hypothetical protein ACK4SY_05205 [Pyrobaculum sp.]
MFKLLYVVTAVAVMLFALVVYNVLEYNKLSDAYNALAAQYNDLVSRYNDLNAAHAKLVNEYNELEGRYNSLEADYNQLRGEYRQLYDSHTALQNSYRQLDAAYGKLKREHEAAVNELARLRSDYRTLSERYAKLQSDYYSLSERYAKLDSDYSSLSKRYIALERDYYNLRMKYIALWNNYTILRDIYNSLSSQYPIWRQYNTVISSYKQWWEWYLTFISWDLSIPRTLNESEIRNLVPLVRNLTNPNDDWGSLLALYRYVVDNIAYAHDIPMPIAPRVAELESGYISYILRDDYAQSPNMTLTLRQGDCDDMAILLYAMIKAYDWYILGKDHDLWFMYVKFEDSAHLALAFPSGKNPTRLTILDPAGQYYTGMPDELAARDPLDELLRYKEYWAQDGHKIVYIAIYEVRGGEAVLLVDGNIDKVADYIRNH